MANHPPTPKGAVYALLDTNALIPPRLSDVLFDCAGAGLFLPRWTRKIEDEFTDNFGDVVFKVPKNERAARKAAKESPPSAHVKLAKKRLNAYRGAVGLEWEVVGYGDPDVISRVPAGVDPDDAHLVAACLVLRDSLSEEFEETRVFLVSRNLKHLSVKRVESLDVEVLKPGKFIDLLCNEQPARMEAALRKTVSDLNGYTKEKLLASLKVHGASETAKRFSKTWGIEFSPTSERDR